MKQLSTMRRGAGRASRWAPDHASRILPQTPCFHLCASVRHVATAAATASAGAAASTAPSTRPRRVAAAAATQYASSPSPSDAPSTSSADAEFDFVCPICLQTHFRLPSMPTQSGGLSCGRCQRTFPSGPAYLDLTLTSGVQQKVYRQRSWGGTELFRNPLVSFAYERGWRQGFAWAGFPGVDKEYDIAMSYLLPAASGKVMVDMSCGSGLFSRRFARSGSFSGVIAADFSESMLQQTREYCLAEGGSLGGNNTGSGGGGSAPIMLLRADVGRLPFATGSVAAIHAGAAIHCWPNPQVALAEISRVLAPGGVFVASTFLTAAAPLGQVLGDDNVRPLSQALPLNPRSQQMKYWEEQELRDLCAAVGLQDFRRERTWQFIMFAVTKPGSPE